MTTQTAARVFHRDQLAEWGVPNDLADESNAAEFPHAAVELHREQTATRRWVSVHELVFRAPDDGKAYRVTYEQGLTEVQEDHDEWDYRDHIVGEEVEEYDHTVKAWRSVAERPAAEPSASITLRPADDPDADLTIEAASTGGMDPSAVAYGLRMAADRFDNYARAQGIEPFPHPGNSLTWEARAEHAVKLYAETAIERDDARAEAAKLRERLAEAVATVARLEQKRVELERTLNAERADVAELTKQRDRIADDTAKALAPKNGSAYAAGLLEAARLTERDLITNPMGEAEEHVNDCFTRFAATLRRKAAEAQQ
ncbi:hypothetical protein [Streptomyces sp. SID5910]|uniref:hypothetical protein n=1 Tax=Streptomyces sp. SID5910 TaxID=2690312 RepID=UPI001370E684|nr:hypothetical protein [Streptomyces sp. SID5910]MYR46621.1 hypothetical protein [Streptomyces sp. SID5910]